jgi:hypothetical protein
MPPKLLRSPPRYNYSSANGRKIADSVFKDFPGYVRGDGAAIFRRTGVPAKTVNGWYRKWLMDDRWRPYSTKRCGKHRRIFTERQERDLAEKIRSDFTNKGLLFTDADFRLLAIDCYYKWHDDDPASWVAAMARDFICSNGFIHRFKKRHRMTSRRVHFKRRPAPDPARRKQWDMKMEELFRSVPWSHILNCDETCWRLYPNGILTWAEIGSENVLAEIDGDEKAGITAMATITADNRKLPLYCIAKGKTTRCEASQLGLAAPNGSDHSESGWQTTETMLNYLNWLNDCARRQLEIPGHEYLHVIMDIYRAHTQPSVLERAQALNIRIHFIPAGYTDQLQPLDRRVFGSLKATAKHLFLMRTQGVGVVAKITKDEAVQMLVKAWAMLSTMVVESAWEIYTINVGQFVEEEDTLEILTRIEAEEEEEKQEGI